MNGVRRILEFTRPVVDGLVQRFQIEIACTGGVIVLILDTMRRAASTEALLESPTLIGR
jgi:hypothetical protein